MSWLKEDSLFPQISNVSCFCIIISEHYLDNMVDAGVVEYELCPGSGPQFSPLGMSIDGCDEVLEKLNAAKKIDDDILASKSN